MPSTEWFAKAGPWFLHLQPFTKGDIMTFDEVKSAVMNLSLEDQKRFIMEVIPSIWPKACADDSCVAKVRGLVDETVVKRYREEHMGNI